VDSTNVEITDIFCDALELASPAELARFLDRACRDAPEVRRRIERLLEAHSEADSFLAACPAVATGTCDAPAEAAGTVIGPYQLLEQIGEGGFGVVFLAEQLQPVHRPVALKVLKPGMDTRQVVARFEAERQALALMDHPHIARIFDAGATAAGRPYFVMELVRGVPITDFCDRNRLPVRERLGLFVSVCRAVQHAHQKRVIHRDLKPSNVLVAEHDGRPVPKVIDYGIAKAAGQPLTDKSASTHYAQIVGTPLYMSPEQAQMSPDIDTRSDIYSLGVLLYELLSGTTPFDQERLRSAAYDEVRRIFREEEPARPSTRLRTLGPAAATASANRDSDTGRLSKLVRGELDWVVMKCLEKDRGRRYETAAGLTRDLERYLCDEPVQACPPSVRYRARKFVHRHRAGLTGGGLALAALVLLGGSLGWVVRDRAARQAKLAADLQSALDESEQSRRHGHWPQAQAAAKRVEELLRDGAADPALAQRAQGLLRDTSEEEAERRLVTRLEEMRLLQAEVKDNHFDLERALPDYRQAFQEYDLGPDREPGEAAARLLRRPERVRGTLLAALDHWLILARFKKAPEADWLSLVLAAADTDAWRQRMRAARERNDRAALEQLAREADVIAQPPEALFLLELSLRQRNATESAVSLMRRAHDAFPGDFWINHTLGMALLVGPPPRPDEAARFLTAATALRPQSPGAWLNLGLALMRAGRLDEAEAAFRQAIARKPKYATAHRNLGTVLSQQGRLDEAAAEFRRVTELTPELAEAHCDLGLVLQRQGEFSLALAELRKGHELVTASPDRTWPYPSARWVRDCQQMVELEDRLPSVLIGQASPADAAEGMGFARVCYFKKLHAASARLWAAAFRDDAQLAENVASGSRYNAACTAALAAADAPDPAEQARWRKQALDWLRADLTAYSRLLESGRPDDRRLLWQRLRKWQSDPDLAGLRDPAALGRLPADERQTFQRLWADARALLSRFGAAP
jgi:serine/threonine-protein kinase